jgi:hypothetical protein
LRPHPGAHEVVRCTWFGEGPLIFGVPRVVSVKASRSSTLVTLPPADCHAILNLSRNSIIPVLKDFVRRGHVEIGYGSIRVLDIVGLSNTIARDV